MRYAILSDVHGNLEALETVLAALTEERIDQFLCAGDVVGYGADPGKCLERLRQNSWTLVQGNHDCAAAGKKEVVSFNSSARAAILWTREQLTPDQKVFLGQAPLVFKNSDLVLVHGTLEEPGEFHYLNTLSDARSTFKLLERHVCFVGHNHVPAIFIEHERGKIEYLPPHTVFLRSGLRYIVNVGSVGQPRDGHPEAAYCVYDSHKKSVEIRRMAYPVRLAQEKIIRARLPFDLAHRLTAGS